MSPFKDTIPPRVGEELDIKKLETFIRKKIATVGDEPLQVEQFHVGKSNLTYQLKIGEWEAVLRRPPHGPLPKKAHDMKREFQILTEIQPQFSAAPKPYLFADTDESPFDKPFFIMERKRGIVLDSQFPEHIDVTEQLCRQISHTMVDTLAQLHSIDYTKTKLVDMTKPDGFMERQVHGWIGRYEKAKTDDHPGVDWLQNWLIRNIPKQQAPSIIHYDFKLNNAMFAEDDLTKLIGLFDWEMTTVGDPLADLGAAMSYWTRPEDPELLLRGNEGKSVTVLPGFMSREEFIQTYAQKTGRDVSDMNFYLTFAYFKLAVICQQIYYRWKKGQTNDERFAQLNHFVGNLIQYCLFVTGEE